MQWGPLWGPRLRSEFTHHVRDSPSRDFIHGLHGKVFSPKAIVLEHFQENACPCGGRGGHRFSVRKCDNAKNARAVSVSGLCETALVVSNDGGSPQQVERDDPRAHFGGNKRRIESILLNGGKQRPDRGRISENGGG